MSDAAQISEPQVEKKTDDVSVNGGVNGEESKETGEPEVMTKSKHKRKKSKAKKAAAAAAAAEASVESAPPVPDVSNVVEGEKKDDHDTPAANADSQEVVKTDAQTESATNSAPKKTVADIMAEGDDSSEAVKAVVDSEEPSTTAPKEVKKDDSEAPKDVSEVRHDPFTFPYSSSLH